MVIWSYYGNTYYGNTYYQVFTRVFTVTVEYCNCFYCNFDHFEILATGANKFRLLIEESLLIKRDQPQLNKNIKSFPLNLFD